MHKYRATDGERIDRIVYKYYGSLEPLEKVIALNSKLEPILSAGDVVLLPEYEIKPKVAKLW